MITFTKENFINESGTKKVAQYLLGVLPKLKGPTIINSRNYDKKLCELTEGLLTHENRCYWDAVTLDGTHLENKKCKGQMWFNLGRYARIYLKLDEDSKIETFTAIYKYSGAKVTEILLIETRNLTERLLRDYTVDDTVKAFYDFYKKCKLPRHDHVSLTYTQMAELASAKISIEKTPAKARPPNQMTQYLVHGQRVKVKGVEGYGCYDYYYGTIGFGGKEYRSPAGFAQDLMGRKSVNGWTAVSAEVRDGKWVTLDEIRKKFCELA